MIYVDLTQVLARLDTIISLNTVVYIACLIQAICSFIVLLRLRKGKI